MFLRNYWRVSVVGNRVSNEFILYVKLYVLSAGVPFFHKMWMTVYFIDFVFPFCPTRFQSKEVDQSVVIIQMERGLRFPAVSELQNLLDDKALIHEKPPSAILDFSNVSSMDYSVVEVRGSITSIIRISNTWYIRWIVKISILHANVWKTIICPSATEPGVQLIDPSYIKCSLANVWK